MSIWNLKGSKKRDDFKFYHKTKLGYGLYGADIDFMFVDDSGIKAILDYKGKHERITWSECKAYDDLMKNYKIFICADQCGDPEQGIFVISRYMGKGKIRFERYIEGWEDFKRWEITIRESEF